jgi:hypothetical protein
MEEEKEEERGQSPHQIALDLAQIIFHPFLKEVCQV